MLDLEREIQQYSGPVPNLGQERDGRLMVHQKNLTFCGCRKLHN
jgi:hypothetical protein